MDVPWYTPGYMGLYPVAASLIFFAQHIEYICIHYYRFNFCTVLSDFNTGDRSVHVVGARQKPKHSVGLEVVV